MNSNKPIVPKPIAPIGATSTQNGQPLFSPSRQGTSVFKLNKTYLEFGPEIPDLRPSHHLKPGRPKVIVKPNIQVKNFRNIQPGVPIFVQGAPGSNDVRTVIPTQVQIPRNVTTQEGV